MKRLSSAWVLLGLLFGIVGESAAIAIVPPQNPNSPTPKNTQFDRASTPSPFQLAQSLGRQGECRAVKREIQLYADNNIRALTGIFLNTNDVLQLLENSRAEQRLIAVFDPQRNVRGYVETSELKLCSPTPLTAAPATVPVTTFNPIPSTRLNTIPSTRLNTIPSTQFTVVPSTRLNTIPSTVFSPIPQTVPLNTTPSVTFSSSQCQVIRETNLYESPGFDAQKGEFLEIGMNLEVDSRRNGRANNFQWIYVATAFGDAGWVILDSVGCR
ncbi:MAG: hypothetical protein J7647_06155 [Cyanobacteria bacterium SBLK]|nr:hypothetical protein [Cyanobacteria bacterium SBLK]